MEGLDFSALDRLAKDEDEELGGGEGKEASIAMGGPGGVGEVAGAA